MGLFDGVVSGIGCLLVGHDWVDRGRYLICDTCGEIKKL